MSEPLTPAKGNIWQWMILPLRRYADFSGRSQRKEYWLYTLFYMLVFITLFAITFAGFPWREIFEADGQPLEGEAAMPNALTWVGFAGIMLFSLGTIVPSIAVIVRRLHDQNLSGWLYLLNFIPYIGFLVIFVFMCIEGTRGPNRYGDDPKGENAAMVFE